MLERPERINLVQDVVVVSAAFTLLFLLIVRESVDIPEGPSADISKYVLLTLQRFDAVQWPRVPCSAFQALLQPP